MSAKRWQGWERTRARGERHYVRVHGVLLWGLSMTVLWCLRYEPVDGETPWYVTAGIALPLFTFGGYLWGKVMWRLMERWYAAAQKVSPSTQGGGP